MVDFNNEKTIGTPAVDIVRILWLQSRYNVFEAWEDYQKKKSTSCNIDLSIVRARLLTLFLEMSAYLKRTSDSKDDFTYQVLHDKLYQDDDLEEKEIIDIIDFLNFRLDKIKLTKLDIKQEYNRHHIEEENKIAGLD